MLNIPEAPGVQGFEANWLGAPISVSGTKNNGAVVFSQGVCYTLRNRSAARNRR
jgi:hypothetical protein